MLTKDTKRMVHSFATLLSTTEDSLIERDIKPLRVASCALSIGAFSSEVGQVSLLDDDKKELRECDTISKVFIILISYVSFINYEILEHIIIRLGTAEDRSRLEAYLSSFNEFCKRSVFEIPASVFEQTLSKNHKSFAIKVTTNLKPTLENIMDIRRKVADILGLNSATLHLCCIQEGCVLVEFLVPLFVAKTILPPSDETLFSLSANGFHYRTSIELAQKVQLTDLALSTTAIHQSDTKLGSPLLITSKTATSDSQNLSFECNICCEQYGEDFNSLPRTLACGHTFCTKCIGRMIEAEGVECPVCNTLNPLDPPSITQVRQNYAVLEVLKNVTKAKDPVAMQPCEVCFVNPATIVCIDCQPGVLYKFCSQCDKDEHYRPFAPVHQHRRYRIDDDSTNPTVCYCSQHHSNCAIFFSEKLHEFACEECTQEDSWIVRSVSFELIPNALRRLCGQARALTKNIKEVIGKLGEAQVTLEKTINELSPSFADAQEALQVKFTEIKALIQERHLTLINKVDDEYDQRKVNLEGQHSEVLDASTALIYAFEEIYSINHCKNDIDFLLRYCRVAPKIEDLLCNENKGLYRPVAHEDIPVFFPEDIIHQLKTLGAVGGSCTPIELDCKVSDKGLLQLSWQLPKGCEPLQKFEIECEHVSDSLLVDIKASGIYIQKEPETCEVSGNVLSMYMNDMCPGYTYRLRLRSLNEVGWGMWSESIVVHCPRFPVTLLYIKKISRIRIPSNGYYRITAKGAKGMDSEKRSGGRGVIVSGTFFLHAGDLLTILCGGMSSRQRFCSGGGGGTFVAVNEITADNMLIAAGGGGGANGIEYDGCDATIDICGTDGTGPHHGKGGVDGGPGMDAVLPEQGYGYGGAGFANDSTTASSFTNGGTSGNCGGFGGGGSVGMLGGGGGGGYSGGGGGGGGGGSYVKHTATNILKEVGWEDDGSVVIDEVAFPYPIDSDWMSSEGTSGYSTGLIL